MLVSFLLVCRFMCACTQTRSELELSAKDGEVAALRQQLEGIQEQHRLVRWGQLCMCALHAMLSLASPV